VKHFQILKIFDSFKKLNMKTFFFWKNDKTEQTRKNRKNEPEMSKLGNKIWTGP
jgi:hypothetical protein